MPMAPSRPCPVPGCPGLVSEERGCSIHPGATGDGEPRPNSAKRGYGQRHRKWRRMVLARQPTCADPFGRHGGRLVTATVADHIVPLRRGGDWRLENGQGLCVSCHNRKTAREQRQGDRP